MGGGVKWYEWSLVSQDDDYLFIYPDILQNVQFRSQIFLIFFATGGKGALTPVTKILRTPLAGQQQQPQYWQ